jgi:hypothetical protein
MAKMIIDDTLHRLLPAPCLGLLPFSAPPDPRALASRLDPSTLLE